MDHSSIFDELMRICPASQMVTALLILGTAATTAGCDQALSGDTLAHWVGRPLSEFLGATESTRDPLDLEIVDVQKSFDPSSDSDVMASADEWLVVGICGNAPRMDDELSHVSVAVAPAAALSVVDPDSRSEVARTAPHSCDDGWFRADVETLSELEDAYTIETR